MLKSRILVSVYLFFGWLAGSASAASEADLPIILPDEPIDIRAPRLMFTNDTVFASGGVTGRYENITLTADSAEANLETGDLRLRGDIHFERDNVIWNGTELEYNYLTQVGVFGPSDLDYDPVLMKVDHIERVATNEYLLKGALFTTCAEDKPHYQVRVREARLIDDKYLKAKGATFYIHGVPVFHFPYWRQTLRKGIFTFKAGYGSEWGAFGLIKATVPWSDGFNSETDVNLYSRRGVGLGQGFTWDYPSAKGRVEGFYLADQDPNAKYTLPDINTDRYRLKLENLQHFSDTQYLNMKWNYLSDPVVLDEFFKSEYRKYAQPENYASWVYGNRYIGSEAFANYRLNDFYDNTDRSEYSLDLYRTRLGNTPFYIQSENNVAYLERVYAKTNALEDVDSVRVDSLNTLYLPQRLGFLSIVPRASYRATYYSKSAVDDSDEFREIPGVGVSLSVQAARVLSERERWYGSGLRHRIEPYLDYSYADSSIATNRIYQFDSVDRFGDEDRLKVGLRNVLQTKRDNRVSRFIDLDLYTHYFPDQNEAADEFDSLFLDARMPLTRRTMVDVEGEIDWNNGGVPFFSTRFSHQKSRYLNLSLEHLYWDAERISLWTPRFDLYPEGRYSLFGYARYEDRSGDLEEFAIGGYMNWCCMRYGLGYHFYDEDDHRIMLSIGLSAFPEASIASGF
jgi:LPS-assembly protein